jgi:hypothetical protein
MRKDRRRLEGARGEGEDKRQEGWERDKLCETGRRERRGRERTRVLKI